MRAIRSISAALAMALSVYILSASPLYAYAERRARQSIEAGRMKNVTVTAADIVTAADTEAAPTAAPQETSPAPAAAPVAAYSTDTADGGEAVEAITITKTPDGREEILETTIEGGLAIKNQTGYKTDIGQLLLAGPAFRFSPEGAQILIIHTHSSEAYTPAGLDKYEASDEARTEDTQYNIVRVGDDLAAVLESAGLHVIHDREIYDYPSYTGSYTRSAQAIANWLADYPSIRMVIDVHRDALGENGTVYKTMAEEDGV